MSVAVGTPLTPFFQSDMSRNRPFTPRLQQNRLTANPPDLGIQAATMTPPRTASNSTFGKKMIWASMGSQVKQEQPSWTREAKKRKELKMRVITQPVGQMQAYQRPQSRQLTASRNSRQWKQRLPTNATELLAGLYETLIMAKNCEVPTTVFWNKFDLSKLRERGTGYSVEDIEHTLSTVGVECNTQVNGKPTSTGRWLLLRHSHFLLRAAHTIVWIDNPDFDPSHPVLNLDHPEHTAWASKSGTGLREIVPVVWDWKSGTERWRWAMWILCGYAATCNGESSNLLVETAEADWDSMTDDGIAVGESISAAEVRDMREVSMA